MEICVYTYTPTLPNIASCKEANNLHFPLLSSCFLFLWLMTFHKLQTGHLSFVGLTNSFPVDRFRFVALQFLAMGFLTSSFINCLPYPVFHLDSKDLGRLEAKLFPFSDDVLSKAMGDVQSLDYRLITHPVFVSLNDAVRIE